MQTGQPPLCLTFSGIVTDDITGQRIDVTFTTRIAQDGTGALSVDARGRRIAHQCGVVKPMMLQLLYDDLFGRTPGGQRVPIPAPVNIDGSPRNRLLDRWRLKRATEPEAAAAD